MHQFICKTQSGVITPTEYNKEAFLKKVLKYYEDANITFKLQIEPIEKNINENQDKLYKVFILKAADHFGNSFGEMQTLLQQFMPEAPRERWSSKELNDFINKSSSHLAEFGFQF